ncbi:fibronectin type III domain-containing protein [Psychroserpens sp. SPM9]|uniref:fibronectin type III domain-containing protein n=1 Tax=Psychroserpens sp. SPM9 TaxID=2975598 RepID=UPI0021A4AB16|nr:fibronectin type III domain-containing protein [Psychroserpens sp. SPM9]MDG5489936.1 fibronectin type III domain-containing protein [Psychroserpens sp. SPM9]
MFKKTCLLLLFISAVVSCNNDDDLIAACDNVTNVSSNTITNNSATITWEASNASALYTLEYGVSGFALGSGITVSESDTDAELTELQANTTYDVYIQTICSASNTSMYTDVYSFTTLAPSVVTEFRPTMSEMNLFAGTLEDLQPTPYAFEYDLNTALFSDYAHKQRFIVLPEGEKLTYDGEGLPLFPDNTLIAKTFYFNNDETDLSLGKHIIETRILIKIDGSWETGDYVWNEAQTEAVLDLDGGIVPVTWIDANGESNSINYEIPSDTDCFTCHATYGEKTPIGPKLRTLNFSVNGTNQLQQLIDNNLIEGLTDPSSVSVLPRWDDASHYSLEERARAYFDINCAHCHIQGGFCEEQSTLNLAFETAFEESNILQRKNSILTRIQSTIPEYGMPYIGTTILHDEGVDLLIEYLDSI